MTSGTKLGPYEIKSPLGAGGMGEVYRAPDARMNRDVAIKILPPAFARDQERLLRFAREARAAAAFNHSNILAIYDIGAQDGSPYIVSELWSDQGAPCSVNPLALDSGQALFLYGDEDFTASQQTGRTVVRSTQAEYPG